MLNIVLRVGRKVFGRVREWALGYGGLPTRIYFALFNEGFRREMTAVSMGIKRYTSTSTDDFYLLRRNVHMLEKGLTMQPRRSEFALDYILETVLAYAALLEDDVRHWSDTAESHWCASVLADYFSVTSSVDSDYVRARSVYDDLWGRRTVMNGYGPAVHIKEPPAVGYDELADLATRRRSVRWYDGMAVPREMVDRAIVVAQESPTACNRQPYRFLVADQTETLSALVDIPMGTKGYGHQIPGLIVVIGDLSAFFDPRDRHLIYVDSCLASMGLILALESQGISSCVINWPDMPERERAIRRVIPLADHERVIMMISYGYAANDGMAPASAKAELDRVRAFFDETRRD